ncbi:MAG: CocE/NonD family hydrolase [Gemmatimonadetes bacterium]|nr:CocE/NonD family hydrolase [Gemmatimonadota bacterium]
MPNPAAVVISIVLAAPQGAASQSDSTVYGVYEKGIRTAEVVVRGARGQLTYTVRRRNRETAVWSDFARALPDSLADGSDRLPGALRLVPRMVDQVLQHDWNASRWAQLTVPRGRARVYERHRAAIEPVGDSTVTAFYWAQRDGGILRDGVPPLDWVVGPGNLLIAAIDPAGDNSLVRRGYEAFTTQKRWSDQRIPPAKYGVKRLPRAMVPMPDGVRLATDVYLPAGAAASRFPTIFLRTPYGIDGAIGGAWYYVARGYAYVVQDVRGRFASEGTWEYVARKIGDGHETLTWITQQPWSDGNIGMTGGSYSGMTQWMTAYKGHPALKALVPVSSMGPPHVDMPYTGGAFTMGSAPYMFSMCAETEAERARGRERPDWVQLLRHRPQIEIDNVGLGRECEYWNFRLSHPIYDEDWKRVDWLRYGDQINVPALHFSGWYDDDFPGTLGNWAMMAAHQRPYQKMVLGAWRHGGNQDREINGVPLGVDVVRDDRFLLTQLWYDRFLKGIRNGVDKGPAVEFYLEGPNVWRTSSQWPPAEAEPVKWYFHSDGAAATSATSGTLSLVAPGAEPPDPYRYDPRDPAPSLIRHGLNEQSLPDNYREIETRPDVVVYTSAPLADDLEIAGNFSAALYASSSARDTDWFVRVTDVDPQGNSIRLVEGLIRARFRESFESEKLLTPGKVERYDIPLRAHGHVVRRGHRLRVNVASAAEGYIFPNSNTGEEEVRATRMVVADQRIFHDAEHPSHVILPVVRRPGP